MRIEDCLLYEFIGAGLILSVVAYDYQVYINFHHLRKYVFSYSRKDS